MDRYVAVDGLVVNYLGPRFESIEDAIEFADAIEVLGVVQLQADYLLSANALSEQLSTLIGILLLALREEGNRRCRLVNKQYSIDAAFALYIAGNTSGIGGIAEVVDNTVAIIDALASIPAANSYNVITDPAW